MPPRLLYLAVSLLVVSEAMAQQKSIQSESGTRATADTVVQNVAAGDWKKGWEAIRSVSVIPVNELNVAEAQIVGEMEKVATRFGKGTGYELITTDKAGDRLVRYQYLVHHEKAPIRWMLVFYKGSAGWVLTDFKFDADYGVLLSPKR